MQSSQSTIQKSNRKKLVIVLLIFILPAMLASFMFFTGWRPLNTVNHGELIVPAKPVEDREMQLLDDKAVKLSSFFGKWTMVYFDSSACDDECNKQLYFMRQTHRSHGKDFARIQRIFVLTDTASIASLKHKLEDYPDMLVLKADQAIISKLRKDFDIDEQSEEQKRNIYFVDPLGNLMMRYRPGVKPADMRKDLERLLKYSSEK